MSRMVTAAHLVDGLVPALLALAGVEWFFLRRRKGTAFDWRENLASLGVAAGHRFAGAVGLLVLRPAFEAMWAHRLWTVPLRDAPRFLLALLCVELAYYWQHRASHAVRWLWASHAVHHTSQTITVAAAYRLGWTDLLSGTPFFVAPVVLIGFPPEAVLVAVALVVAYQGWIHTELVPPLPWFDRVFNSPANHRVHHATDDGYAGRNFGAVLVVFDRLFGTYAPEVPGRPRSYGLAAQVRSYAPMVIAFHEWVAMIRDVRASRSATAVLRACFGSPEARRPRPVTGQQASSA
jgi:sterol desaturase/sphingolipid hydroxylase (fatty acid hydroxylase superfamily)